MKYIFFFSLLVNVVFFLWEMNNGALNPTVEVAVFDPKAEKQILLLSEFVKTKDEITRAVNSNDVQKPSITLTMNEHSAIADSPSVDYLTQTIIEQEKNIDTLSQFVNLDELKLGEASDNSLITVFQFSDELVDKAVIAETLASNSDVLIKNEVLEAGRVNTLENQIKLDITSTLKAESVKKEDNKENPSIDEKRLESPQKKQIVADLQDSNPVDVNLSVKTEEREPKAVLLNDSDNEVADLPSVPAKLKKQYCYQIGPFKDKAELYTWQKTNHLESASLQVFNKENKTISGYLVNYPAGKKFSDSANNEKMLRRKGIKDLWLFRRGELKGVISLGLFVDENRALLLKKKLANKGLVVEIMPRYKVETPLYVELENQEEVFMDTLIISESQNVSKQCETKVTRK